MAERLGYQADAKAAIKEARRLLTEAGSSERPEECSSLSSGNYRTTNSGP